MEAYKQRFLFYHQFTYNEFFVISFALIVLSFKHTRKHPDIERICRSHKLELNQLPVKLIGFLEFCYF